jgi:hypothetical protein
MYLLYLVRVRTEAKYAEFYSKMIFVKANGIQLISGRDFMADDSAKILINRSAHCQENGH